MLLKSETIEIDRSITYKPKLAVILLGDKLMPLSQTYKHIYIHLKKKLKKQNYYKTSELIMTFDNRWLAKLVVTCLVELT